MYFFWVNCLPWVDALVKLIYALGHVVQMWFRPVVGGLMTAFGVYAHIKGIDLGNSHAIFDAAFPAWGVSRHMEKGRKDKHNYKERTEFDEWGD